MASFSKDSFEDLDITREEIETIGNALKKEEFRNLLLEYVEEINDPENRKQYENEITQLEKERGVDITFIHPHPGYVIKTSVNGEKKAFINICQNDKIGKPLSTPTVESNAYGSQWSIPYSQAPPREDLDKNKNKCIVYDVVFHPDTLLLGKKDIRLKNLINDTALNAVEESFKVTLDKKNIKFPKMQFKGMKQPTVIRKKNENIVDPTKEIFEIPNYPYPPISEEIKSKNTTLTLPDDETEYIVPKYQIKYRNHIDMQDFTNDMYSKQNAAIPNEITVEIDLPLLKSATDLTLDVREKSLYLVSEKPSKYKLELTVPYVLKEDQGNAKFDKSKKKLIVVLPVQQEKRELFFLDSSKEDSGVESDLGNCRNNDVSSGDEEISENKPSVCDCSHTVNKISADEPYRTNKKASFLIPNVNYSLPSFVHNFCNGVLAFTFQVRNVDPGSINHSYLSNSSGFHLTFLSMGSGFFPMHYAVCVKFPHGVITNSLNVEVWDDNVIAQVKLGGCDFLSFTDFCFGLNEENVKVYSLHEPDNLKNYETTQENQEKRKCIPEPEYKIKVIQDNLDKVVLHIAQDCSSRKDTTDTNGHVLQELEIHNVENTHLLTEDSLTPLKQTVKHVSAKLRTVSECATKDDRLNRRLYRGILKTGRSLSESSADDYLGWSDKNQIKKTVRFSDVISQQSFRSQSSILGQRKKNQRKTKNKKRAKERRLSESGGESEGEAKNENDELEAWKRELIQDISDASSVSEVSDVSESDDGQKEETNNNIASSKKHKRRGKKSARKNAHTAKVQFSNNISFGTD